MRPRNQMQALLNRGRDVPHSRTQRLSIWRKLEPRNPNSTLVLDELPHVRRIAHPPHMYSITLPSLNPDATYLAPGEKASERGRAAVTVPVMSLGSRWESEPEEPVAPDGIPDLHHDGREDRPREEDLHPVL